MQNGCMCSMPTQCQSDWMRRPLGPRSGRRARLIEFPATICMSERAARACRTPAAGDCHALRVPATAPACLLLPAKVTISTEVG